MDAPTLELGCSKDMNDESRAKEQSETENVPQDLSQQGMKTAMEVVKASNSLPIDEQRQLMSLFPEFLTAINEESGFVLSLLSDVIRSQGVSGNIARRDSDEKYELVIETNDIILERVDSNLDEIQGIKRNPDPVVGKIISAKQTSKKQNSNQKSPFPPNNRPGPGFVPYNAGDRERRKEREVVRLINTRITQRPQIKFKDKIDNRNIPFEPRIKDKPNALKQLAILVEKVDERGESFSHPYEYELDLFKPPEEQLKIKPPQKYKPTEEVPLIQVQDGEALQEMMAHLRTQTEIAVDLEHHSYRTFQGFTCLVQISSREKDFVIDALELRDKLYVLNEVFTDPKIVKVFHGAESDIEWLQRDLCVYVVNMFDTHQAAQVLNFTRLSLAHLLKIFCTIDSNKTFQLYDWRTRPLSKDAIKYAREDTHYLLYIYDNLRNSLIEKCNNKTNLLDSVIYRSTEVCKRKYWKVRLNDDSHMELYRKSRKMYDNRQMYALKHLFQWRDKVAREEDESYMYVLPNHMMLQIAETIPKEMQGILACCNPVPPLVRQNLITLHYILLKAREQSLVKRHVDTEVQRQATEQQPNWKTVNVDSKLHCPHDLSYSDDLPENLPTVLADGLRISPVTTKTKAEKCALSVFQFEEALEEMSSNILRKHIRFVSPYQRYKKVMAFMEAEESKSIENSTMETEENKTNAKEIIQSPVKVDRTALAVESSTSEVANAQNLIKEVEEFEISRRLQEKKRKLRSSSPDVTEDGEQNTESPKSPKKKKKKQVDVNSLAESQDNEVGVEESIDSVEDNGTKQNEESSCAAKPIEEQPNIPPDLKVTTMECDDGIIPEQKANLQEGEIVDEAPSITNEENIKGTSKERRDMTPGGSPQKKTKKDEAFEPFNFGSVDFSRFQTEQKAGVKQKKKNTPAFSKGRRTPWLGKKLKKAGI